MSLSGAVAEGLLLAEYASRMRLKNRIEIGALTEDTPFSADRYLDDSRETLDELATEAEEVAERIAGERRWSASLEGDAEHVHDYRAADITNLRRREELSESMATTLRERAGDETFLLGLIERARDDAWGDIAASIEDTLERRHIPVDATYRRERARRIRQFISEDLARLTAQKRE
ncbi:MAG TPA: asparagine synthase [Microbacteriaceae bacterium]